MRLVETWPVTQQGVHMLRKLALLCALTIGMALLFLGRADPVLIHNASPSVPRGFYLRSAEAPRVGAYVTVRAARVAPAYARTRNFADPTDSFIKRVAAVGGTTVCAHGARVTIDGVSSVTRAASDSLGRPLPSWSGCLQLAPNQVFLLGQTDDSFDSRYWGPISTDEIDGVWDRIEMRRPSGK